MYINEDIPVAATLTDLEVCQSVCEEDLGINIDDSEGGKCVEENSPTNAEMRQKLDILKVQHRSTNFKRQYTYEQYRSELLRNNCRQATIN
ncbi:hypothetical protein AVEN_33756-1 [Araneus ventricosus]|uniref:Uncharacterized protein n=1 Tax=Araneus ventricosus TaxID=182803 RepID=A0A4Y2U3L7_ARAVE|nr:hypothetical protein AVEN_33756-1 [Araneus ventricosus]